jgi:hypothetical protein
LASRISTDESGTAEKGKLVHRVEQDKYTSWAFARPEAAVVQHLALDDYRDSNFVVSDFHSGPGQAVFGLNAHSRCDFCALNNGHITYVQYHESKNHAAGVIGGKGAGHETVCPQFDGRNELAMNAATAKNDAFCSAFARYLSSLDTLEGVRVSYRVVTECEAFHCKNVRSMHAKDAKFIRKPKWLERPFTADDLVRRLKAGQGLGSFVAIKGGREKEDEHSSAHGFCLQRGRAERGELGPGAEYLAKKEVEDRFGSHLSAAVRDKEVEKVLKNRTALDVTMLKKSFSGTTSLSAPHFLWLIEKRGLHDFELLHVLWYEPGTFHSTFFKTLLQKRHDFTAQGKKDGLESFLLKLTLNSGTYVRPPARSILRASSSFVLSFLAYGYFMVEASNFFNYG